MSDKPNQPDMSERLARLEASASGSPVTAEDLQVAGAMAVILREAIKPNLMQVPLALKTFFAEEREAARGPDDAG